MDAGGAIVHRATREAAGCGRLLRDPAARRAAKNKPYPHPEHHQGSRQDAGVDGVSGYLGRAAGRGVDAQVERGYRAIRAKAGACSHSREPGTMPGSIACLSCRLISVLYYIVYYYIEIPREPAAALVTLMGATGLEPVTPAM